MDKQEIIDYYNTLCQMMGKSLSRGEYRKLNPTYSSSLIEKVFGTWTDFANEANQTLELMRVEKTKRFDTDVDKVVISYVHDGSIIDFEALEILENYCKKNKAELGILWGKSVCKKAVFAPEVYDRLEKYLATKFEFVKDPGCIAQDFLIPFTQKNPLMRLDQISTRLSTIIAGSTKQYEQILPYKQYNKYRIGASTGTLSKIDYKMTSGGFIDIKYHTTGGLLLEWDNEEDRYVIRNLVIKNGKLYDLNKCYTKTSVENLKSVPAMTLGDLHFPEQDERSIEKTHNHISLLNPKIVVAGDWCSYNSINHHTKDQALTRVKNRTRQDWDLETELSCAAGELESLVNHHPKTQFHIIYSNHDKFLTSFLNDGLFVKDVDNAEIGCKLFLQMLHNKPILNMDTMPKNITFMTEFDELEVEGVDLSNHGHIGIAGSRGNPKTYTRICDKAITGHTHSPKIEGSVVVVGTNSKMKLTYTSNISNWAFGNAIVHENGTIQLLLA